MHLLLQQLLLRLGRLLGYGDKQHGYAGDDLVLCVTCTVCVPCVTRVTCRTCMMCVTCGE